MRWERRNKLRKERYRLLQEREVVQENHGGPATDRLEIDEKIREAKRRGDFHSLYKLLFKHPLRPIEVRGYFVRLLLGREGFETMYGSFMLPPEGVSRRAAKARRDWMIKEVRKTSPRGRHIAGSFTYYEERLKRKWEEDAKRAAPYKECYDEPVQLNPFSEAFSKMK